MLTITETAATVLNETRKEKGAPAEYGVRFFTKDPNGSGRARLAFRFVESPQADDTVLPEAPIEAYVAPDVERLVGDATVDTKQDGDHTSLVVKRAQQG